MIGETIALNREYNDLVSPTGKIGQINEAKKIYAKQFEDYLEDATKNKGFSREDALYNWQTQHHPKYTGYNDKNEITNISPYGAPKRLILQDDLKTVKSLLGESTRVLMKNNDFGFSHVQDLIDDSNSYPKMDTLQPSSWANSVDPYYLWDSKANPMHTLLWSVLLKLCDVPEIALQSINFDSTDDVPCWKNNHLDPAAKLCLLAAKMTHSDQFWWANKATLIAETSLYNKGIILSAIALYTEVLDLIAIAHPNLYTECKSNLQRL